VKLQSMIRRRRVMSDGSIDDDVDLSAGRTEAMTCLSSPNACFPRDL
jgi:hypothetical protein